MITRVLGIDPSLTGTGLAVTSPGGGFAVDTVTSKVRGPERLDRIRRVVLDHVTSEPTETFAVIEGPSYGSQTKQQKGHHERGGLWWLIAWSLWRAGVPYAVCPPATRSMWATGKGNASKAEVMLAVERRFPGAGVANDNEADAVVLGAAGAQHLGWLTGQPAYSTAALAKVEWPAMVGDQLELPA